MNRMRLWLAKANPVVFVAFAGLAGFCAYFLPKMRSFVST